MADWPLAQSDGQIITTSSLPASTDYGVTPIAGTGAKGSWIELISALPYDIAGFYLQCTGNGDAANYVTDIGIGASTAEVVLIADFCVGTPRTSQAGPSVYFPVRVKKGTRMALRTRSTVNGSGIAFHALFIAAGFNADPGFSRVTTYGISTIDGQSIDPGGSANTKGSWTTLQGPATINPIRSLILCVSIQNTAATTCIWRLDIGVGATPLIVIPDLIVRANATSDDLGQTVFGPFPLSIPGGLAIKARAQCNITDATDRVLYNVVAYGID